MADTRKVPEKRRANEIVARQPLHVARVDLARERCPMPVSDKQGTSTGNDLRPRADELLEKRAGFGDATALTPNDGNLRGRVPQPRPDQPLGESAVVLRRHAS